MRTAGTALAGLLMATPAAAQEDVIAAADDAFGRRIGVEQVGLYSETSVRGFSLESAGNYRIDDHYFVRDAAPVNPTVAETLVRVGANALRYDFPAPSGIFQYRLVEADPGVRGAFEVGYRGGNGGPILEVNGAAADQQDRIGIAGGVQIAPWQHYVDGTKGTYFSVGLVPRWTPAPGVVLRAVASKSWWEAGTDTNYATDGTFLPPRVKRWVDRGQRWTRFRNDSLVGGLTVDAAFGEGWRLGGSLFLSESKRPRTSFNLLTLNGNEGSAQATAFQARGQRSRSWSGELFATREFGTGELRHRLVAMLRARDSRARLNPGVRIDLGETDILASPTRIPRPDVSLDLPSSRDEVAQYGVGVGYRLSIGSLLELRGDVQKVRYRKSVQEPGELPSSNRSTPWLYSGSATLAASDRLTVFASHTRGLEEAGSAPANAVNRNEVLPASLARQSELGIKYRLADELSLIAGLFDITKPFPGLRPDGVYGFVGDVNHRGAELSLAGPLTPRLNLVAGVSLMKAELSGLLLDNGTIGAEPVGTPERLILANLAWQVPWVDELALDGGITLRGGTEANLSNSLQTPGYAIVNIGLRQGFKMAGQDLSLRARVTNLFDRFAWNVSSAQLYYFNGPRAFTLTLSGNL